MTTPLSAVIFDFDGVILDSNDVKTNAFRQVFARFPQHADAMMAYHQAHVWQSRFEKFTYLAEQLLGRCGDRALVNDLAAEYAEILRDRMDACPFVPGAREMLDELSGCIPLYLASVTPEPELLRLLRARGIDRHFTRVFGCPPWTKPGAVKVIVDACQGPAGIVLVGDSAGDQRAAAAAGVEFIARDSGLAFDPPVEALRDVRAIATRLKTRIAA